MFYNEINDENICFHVTTNELPLSDKIILSDVPQLGRKWNGTDWEDVPEPVEEMEQEVLEEAGGDSE